MDHIDTNGWELPGGVDPQECIRIVRGSPRMVERLLIEVPINTGLTLSDLTIGGQPLRYGGQLAECITVKLVGAAARLGKITDNAPTGCQYRGMLDPNQPSELVLSDIRAPLPPGYVPAFELEGGNSAEHRPPPCRFNHGRLGASTHRGRRMKSRKPKSARALGTNVGEAAKPKLSIDPPTEPILVMGDIQGIAIPGFLKPHQTLLYVRLPNNRGVVGQFRRLVAALPVTNAGETLADRRAFRRSANDSAERARSDAMVLLAIGFTYEGLLKLTPGAFDISSEAFRHGLVARSRLLGDSPDPRDESNPANWVVGAPGAELDALIVLAGGNRERVSERASEVAKELSDLGADVRSEDGDVREGVAKGHEHFGFDDGVSQPGIRALASNTPGDWITERTIDPTQIPAAWLYGDPGQDLVWPGEFVLGYVATSPDPLLPGPVASATPAWTRNGSFLVYRRLRQDVGLFWRTMREEATLLAGLPGFDGMTDDRLAALLVGRWPSGAPVNRVPEDDNPALGANSFANNNFRFDSDTPIFKLVGGYADRFPPAKADPAGVSCPWAAHIRKVNVRDSSSDMGARSATLERRILRVGVPFGKSLMDRYAETADDPERGQRGLLFLSIQSLSTAETKCAKWRRESVPVELREKGHEALASCLTDLFSRSARNRFGAEPSWLSRAGSFHRSSPGYGHDG
jgi:Dyp-type peroxidase family